MVLDLRLRLLLAVNRGLLCDFKKILKVLQFMEYSGMSLKFSIIIDFYIFKTLLA